MKKIYSLLIATFFCGNLFSQTYSFPDEALPHEGTWLQWPHQYEYGITFRNENDATWVAMTKALQANEKVHIIAYNVTEQTRITNLLIAASVPLTNIDFKIFQTNDVWVRDNGPIYVRNSLGNLVIQDWGFNGWGGDFNFAKCNPIPTSIATATSAAVVNLNSVMVVEGGSWEMDGAGTFIATKSSILSQSNPSAQIKSIRNLGMTESQANSIFSQYLGATKFIWLDGWFSQDDITDAHIDGFAKFAPENKLVTMNQTDLLYWGLPQSDINKLYAATNASNISYTKVYLPLTQNDVSKTNGTSLGYKGSYANYYVANNRVLVPNYNDPNDAVANAIIATLYPGRTVVGIDCRNLYENGGMVHCVTQQQPNALPLPLKLLSFNAKLEARNNVLLNWQTANEVNVSHINIQRSTNGKDFITIGKVAASCCVYSFIDVIRNLELGIWNWYYHLEVVDNDGSKTYSTVQQITIKPQTINSVNIYPNPATTSINIECKGAIELFIIDYLGKITMNKKLNNNQNIAIHTQQFSKGIYFIKAIMNNGEEKMQKLIIN